MTIGPLLAGARNENAPTSAGSRQLCGGHLPRSNQIGGSRSALDVGQNDYLNDHFHLCNWIIY